MYSFVCFVVLQKRLVQREQRYFTQGIDGTPFSLGIAMPQGYGRYKVYGQIELSLEMSDPRSNKGKSTLVTGWSQSNVPSPLWHDGDL